MGHKFSALIQFETRKASRGSVDLDTRSAVTIVKNWLNGRGLPDWVSIIGSGVINLQSIQIKTPPPRSFSEDFVGLAEVAEMANVSKMVICNWRKRKEHFPPPLVELAQGPVWTKATIEYWLDEFGLRKGGTRGKKARNDASN